MAYVKATLAKEVDGVVQYIYPKTTADMVEYDSNYNVDEKIANIESEIVEARVDRYNVTQASLAERLTADLTDLAASISNLQNIVSNSTGDTVMYNDTKTINEVIDEILAQIQDILADIANLQGGDEAMYDSTTTIKQKITDLVTTINNHLSNESNPHSVTAKQLGAAVVSSGVASVPSSAGWSSSANAAGYYTCTVSVPGFTTNTRAHITPTINVSDMDTANAQQEAWDTHAYSETVGTSSSNGGIKFYAETKPTTAVEFTWEVIETAS